MEAKDTVISLGKTDNESLRILMEKILLEQAEISFKTGRALGAADGIDVGRQEVVEYKSESMMAYHDKFCEDKKVVILVIPQAQLKEWGIKQ